MGDPTGMVPLAAGARLAEVRPLGWTSCMFLYGTCGSVSDLGRQPLLVLWIHEGERRDRLCQFEQLVSKRQAKRRLQLLQVRGQD